VQEQEEDPEQSVRSLSEQPRTLGQPQLSTSHDVGTVVVVVVVEVVVVVVAVVQVPARSRQRNPE
jgi:hypothetical protein